MGHGNSNRSSRSNRLKSWKDYTVILPRQNHNFNEVITKFTCKPGRVATPPALVLKVVARGSREVDVTEQLSKTRPQVGSTCKYSSWVVLVVRSLSPTRAKACYQIVGPSPIQVSKYYFCITYCFVYIIVKKKPKFVYLLTNWIFKINFPALYFTSCSMEL